MWVGPFYLADPEATAQYGTLFFALSLMAALVLRGKQ